MRLLTLSCSLAYAYAFQQRYVGISKGCRCNQAIPTKNLSWRAHHTLGHLKGDLSSEETVVAAVRDDSDERDLPSCTNQRSAWSWGSLLNDLAPESIVLLNLVAIIWGSQHAVIKMVVDDSDAGAFTLLRFGVAALIASPYTPKDKISWRWGTEMGFWMFLGYSFQAVGLEFTTAQKSGFLLYLNVKFVPFLASVLFGREISLPTWTSAVVAFTGTALLSIGPGQSGLDLNAGDLWSIAAAMASAMFILRLETASKAVKDSSSLNSASLWCVAVLAGIWTTLLCTGILPGQGVGADFTNEVKHIVISHPLELVYLSGVTTALANYIQSKAQKDVSAERASVIYAMDPVYGALFSSFLLGEQLNGWTGWTGAGLITLAAATNAFLDFTNSTETTESDVVAETVD